MNEDNQPNPDELLKAVQAEENKTKSGKLKIFFGMSAGVGKTYAMLEEANRKFAEGVNVVVGVINTHGRKETEGMLKEIPIIPEKKVTYKESIFEEMDLEKIIEINPSLVLVDELAHTNVPGSNYAKRWQDVIELLDKGIDVYTTLNVQHIESRKDLVESFAEIQVRETVPDLILERATSIELIDISPEQLLQRLKEGKVYLGNQSKLAAQNFFKIDTLTALREIALRFTAEKVDHDLHSILSRGKGWKTREKLMVGISPNPRSQQLIRRTRRRAFELDSPWVAVYVDTNAVLTDEEQSQLNENLALAKDLGAEVITTLDNDIATGLQSIAKSKNVTQLILGHPDPSPIFNFFRKNFIMHLGEKNPQLDLVILRAEKRKMTRAFAQIKKNTVYEYCLAIFTSLAILGIGFLSLSFLGYKSIGQIFLLGILFLSFFVGPGPIFLAALLSTIFWNFFFMPPLMSFALPHGEDLILTIIYFCTAAILGISTVNIRRQDRILKIREKKVLHLYEIEKEIILAQDFHTLRQTVSDHLATIFDGKFDLLMKNQSEEKSLLFDSFLPSLQEEKEQGVALWTYQNGKNAGWSTSVLPSAKGFYIPIQFLKNTLGVLAYFPTKKKPLSLTEMNFLYTVCQQVASYINRFLFTEEMSAARYSNQLEKFRISILKSVSNQFNISLNDLQKKIHN